MTPSFANSLHQIFGPKFPPFEKNNTALPNPFTPFTPLPKPRTRPYPRSGHTYGQEERRALHQGIESVFGLAP